MHVSEEQLQSYVTGALSEEDCTRLKSHLDECGRCRTRLAKSRTDVPVEPKYSCGSGIELQQASEALVAVDLPALRHSHWRQ